MNDWKNYCVLCGKKAITTAAHIPVCKEHDDEYHVEGRQYLPFEQRVFYQMLLAAYEAKKRRMGE